jgi:phosphatidylglycerophosphate synthase
MLKKENKPPRQRFRQETVIHSFITRPLSIEIIRLIWGTRISPNQITIFRAVLNAISLILFLSGDLTYCLIGFLLFHLHELLDCVDGLYARLTGQCSQIGYVLENVLDTLLSTPYGFLGLSMVWGLYMATNVLLPLHLYVLLLVLALMREMVSKFSMVLVDVVSPTGSYEYLDIFTNSIKLNAINFTKTVLIWRNEPLMIAFIVDVWFDGRTYFFASILLILILLEIYKLLKKIYDIFTCECG